MMKLAHTTRRTILLVLAAAIVGGAIGIGLDRVVLAQQASIKRTILQRSDDPGATTHEAVMGVAEIPPGATSGKHRHYGIELGYVLEGPVTVDHEGRPTATFKTGETFKMDGVHEAKNTGTTPAKVLAIYLVEKGKPLAEPVK